MILKTDRLILRQWRPGEENILKRFLGDERVMYAYEGAFTDEEISKWLTWNLESYREKGFGLWAIERKSDNKIIGECGITEQIIDNQNYFEIGYHLAFDEWGKGYMIEAAEAVKYYGFDILHLDKLISIIRDTNIASMNVAIRNGMTIDSRFIKNYKCVDMPHYLFSIVK